MSALQMKTESLMKVRQQLVEARMPQTQNPFVNQAKDRNISPEHRRSKIVTIKCGLHGNPQLVQEVLLRIVQLIENGSRCMCYPT